MNIQEDQPPPEQKLNESNLKSQNESQNAIAKGDLEDEADFDEDKAEMPQTRQDLYVCFTNDKDLRHPETISIKAQMYKGISVKVKILNHIWIENLLFAIESAKDHGIVNLRFEECKIMKRAVQRLIQFCQTTSIIESFGLVKISFDDGQDFKKLVEAVSFNQTIKQFSVQAADFDEDFHGKTMARCILESRSLKELDLSYVTFEDPKSFYEMANGLLNERCRLGALKLKGIAFGQLEGKVMQFILMRNKSLQTLDLSQCSTDSPENLENVFCKFDQFCNIRTLVAENLDADFNYVIEIFGEALGVNTKLEGLSLKENKLKQTQYCNFWELMSENRSLRKINVAKTEITDKVCSKISNYLRQPDLRLQDLNLSRNQIAAEGLIALAEALQINVSLRTLNLAQNFIREGGIQEFVLALRVNNSLQELCLSFNKINNHGLSVLSGFLLGNKMLKVLDISRNAFSDAGFIDFAKGLAHNQGIQSLNLSKNKDVSDEFGLRELAYSLATNSSLSVIDLNGLKVRKPCVIQYFQPALKQNITLKRIVGKIPPGIITADLKDNITIESDILKNYKLVRKEQKRELSKNIHRVNADQSQLNLKDQGNDLLQPALKFIRYKKIHVVDLSSMQLEDDSLRQLSVYLEENPEMRSLGLANNYFTDDGVSQLIQALRNNSNLNHINLMGCLGLTEQNLIALQEMVTEINMSLYSIEIQGDDLDVILLDKIQDQASMNRAIQENLKPMKINHNGLVEIQFSNKVRIADYFNSAIKAWRIMEPSIIRAVNEGLGDHHVEKLCAFLSGRNLVKQLNLRRNYIGDIGAIAIANYVKKADRTLVSIELERNDIGDKGGEALLKAMQTNMRMECCKMAYGNPLRQKICRQIEREINANNQIKANVVPAYKQNNNSLVNYEESDRGPDFVRCALKSCELFKILHLSLPDNMIGEKEMIDISYVLSRNTPLMTLNLSNNVIDAKAAMVLANSLGSNSHLKEIDLRYNKLKDAGIALLMEIFVQQKIYKRLKSENKLKGDDAQWKLEKKKFPKLKMKISKIILDCNQHTVEALKHIYTVLMVNPIIEISIDFPFAAKMLQEEIGESSFEQEEIVEISPTLVVPITTPMISPTSDNDQILDTPVRDILPDDDGKLEIENMTSDEERMKRRVPILFRFKFCKPCREICYRDPSKPKKSLTRIFCSSFLLARKSILKFKTSTQVFLMSEKRKSSQNLHYILLSFFLFFIIGIVLPFLASFSGPPVCSSMSPIYVYGAYCGYILISTFLEISILMSLRKSLNQDQKKVQHLPFNQYLFAKWCQGQFSNFVTFMHYCFVASALICFIAEGHQVGNQVLATIIKISAILATPILLFSNARRFIYLFKYLKSQPKVHKLLPQMQRNTQLAWLCNMQATAASFESISLSDYIFENKGPILVGKEKDWPEDLKHLKIKTITNALLQDKMRFQDFPMLAIMSIHFFATFGAGNSAEFIVSLIQIGTTALSIFSGMVSLKWAKESKGVDLRNIIKTIQGRQFEIEKKKEEINNPSPLKRMETGKINRFKSMQNQTEEQSSNDTDRSGADSNGLNNVLEELEMLTHAQESKDISKQQSKEEELKSPTLKVNGIESPPPNKSMAAEAIPKIQPSSPKPLLKASSQLNPIGEQSQSLKLIEDSILDNSKEKLIIPGVVDKNQSQFIDASI